MATQWEYITFRWELFNKQLNAIDPSSWRSSLTGCKTATEAMNRLGESGWELVGEPVVIAAGLKEYTLKRQRQ